ncbi:MAG TPA: type ISP restriction/modification enzyme [Thermodesulfobacteriota bacterium]
MSEKKLARVFYADLWGLRDDKYKYLFKSDVKTTKWQELEPTAPYYFLVPKDFALQSEYDKFWKVTEIFKQWSSGVKTHRDHFVVGYTKEELAQRLRVFGGNLSDELVKESLNLKDTGSWKLSEARQKVKGQKLEDKIYPYAYRPFDVRRICYESALIDRNRWPFMKCFLKENLGITFKRSRYLRTKEFHHLFVVDNLGDINFFGDQSIFFPLYVYHDEPVGAIHELPLQKKFKTERSPNLTPEFLQAIKDSVGSEPTTEEVFYYIYAVLYSPTYRKRYEEFLKIDFPRIPLPSNNKLFGELSVLGKELIELHLLKASALDETGIGFPKDGSRKVEKVSYDEQNLRVFINKEQYFEGISNEVWTYRIGAYQVMEKYLKDRKNRKLSLDEINHYMKVAKAIRLTIELQKKIDNVYRNNITKV